MARAYNVKIDPLFPGIWESADEERRAKAVKRYESVSKRGKEGTTVLSREAWIAAELVKVGWRASNPAISAAWHSIEEAARESIRNPGQQFSAMSGRATYLVRNGFMWLRGPSGECLAYAAPRLRDQVWAKVKLDDGSWSDPEVMDREEAERLELLFKVQIQGPTSPRITFLGLDKSGKHMVRQGLYGGLIFENCLSGETEVLTPSGWRMICMIRPHDTVWDGYAFVSHDGLVCKGVQQTIDLGGVRLTPDHKVWTNDGWKRASDTNFDEAAQASPDAGSSRPGVRPVDGHGVRRQRRDEGSLACFLQVWRGEDLRRVGASKGENEQLRMLEVGDRSSAQKTRHVVPPDLPRLSIDARPLRTAITQGVQAQAVARDLLVNGMWKAEGAGYPIIATVYDEI
jgi:hypothetical protein